MGKLDTKFRYFPGLYMWSNWFMPGGDIMNRILYTLAFFGLIMAVLFCALCAKADTSATIGVSITIVSPPISINDGVIDDGEAVPVPTDDGSLAY